MGYYSLRDPIHYNDVINNGHDITALAAFKKHLRELLYFKSSVQVQASTAQLEKRTESLKDCKGGRNRKRAGRGRKTNVPHYVPVTKRHS